MHLRQLKYTTSQRKMIYHLCLGKEPVGLRRENQRILSRRNDLYILYYGFCQFNPPPDQKKHQYPADKFDILSFSYLFYLYLTQFSLFLSSLLYLPLSFQ